MKGVLSRLSRVCAWLDRLCWTVILIAHATGAAAWWWLMPGGFDFDHPRFWMNRVLPIVLLLGMLIARSPWPRNAWATDLRFSIKAALATFWIVLSVALLINFHLSFRWKFIAPLLLGAFMGLSLIRQRRSAERTLPAWNALPLIFGFIVGALIPTWQHALPPATLPGPMASQQSLGRASRGAASLRIDEHATMSTQNAAIHFTSGMFVLEVNAFLNFDSVSPDGCWTLFAPAQGKVWRPPSVQSYVQSPGSATTVRGIIYAGQATMAVLPDDGDGRNEIRVSNTVREFVWSHLNTYTQMSIAGHKRLYLSFSPCPQARIEVMPSDYPFGRPARFAYLDASEMFHIAEATSAEKGPFKDLGSGRLARGEALSITLYDEDKPVYRVSLKDWSRQCSTQLSPTAGWGVPENSIEFSLEGSKPDSPASIFITLAATSVGRGFDTVGHSPGTYLNNLIVERLTVSPTTSPQ